MRCVVVPEHGAPQVMVVREAEDPKPHEGEVRLRVQAAGQNYADTLMRLGLYPGVTVPFVPGMEVAGTVDMVGAGVDWPRPGDRVAALLFEGGGYAELAIAKARFCVPLPDTWSFEQGAAFLLQHLTAWHALTTIARAEAGELVVVHAAAGGVGGAAVEYAKLLGLSVVATASTEEKRAAARELGADAVCDYEGFVSEVQKRGGANIVLESVGSHVLKRSLECLAPLGRLVLLGFASRRPASLSSADLIMGSRAVMGFHLRTIASQHNLYRESASLLMHHVDQGHAHVRIGARFPLSQATDAHVHMESRQSHGKILLIP